MGHIVIYPGTFDPMTLGHVDLIERAARLFDRVIVAVAINANKQPLFSLSERVSLASQVLAKNKNVEVCGFECLLIDFAKQKGANIILRGLRAISDFEYEYQLASINRRLEPSMESLFLMPAENFASISSRFVREIATLGGDVTEFVPEAVVAALKKKLR